MGETSIQWSDAVWNPTRGCTRVSPGCENCYAERQAWRHAWPYRKPDHPWEDDGQGPYHGLVERSVSGSPRWNGKIRLVPEKLEEPLHWRPRRVFVDSMSDLFHENVPDEFIDQVFAVMALCPQHTFQVLTKRAERMRDYASDPETPGRVAKALDCIEVEREIARMGPERFEPCPGFPGYLISDRGYVYTELGSDSCVRCGAPMPDGIARRRYCGSKCRQMDAYDRQVGKLSERSPTRRRMEPMPSEQGHCRVMLYRDGETHRPLIHRLVLEAFDRPPEGDEQSCHRNGDPTVNALPNLRWGTQSDNWQDRKRHGTGGPSDFAWPLPNVWLGCSVEDQKRADERIPLLLQTPAAVRFLSVEPLLGPVDLFRWLEPFHDTDPMLNPTPRPGWVIVGGESGPGARPCSVEWIRSVLRQCREAQVPAFCKQLGSRPIIRYGDWKRIPIAVCWTGLEPAREGVLGVPDDDLGIMRMMDRKGGDPLEWPSDLNVREFPDA